MCFRRRKFRLQDPRRDRPRATDLRPRTRAQGARSALARGVGRGRCLTTVASAPPRLALAIKPSGAAIPPRATRSRRRYRSRSSSTRWRAPARRAWRRGGNRSRNRRPRREGPRPCADRSHPPAVRWNQTGRARRIPESDKRHVVNDLRETLGLIGVPIRLSMPQAARIPTRRRSGRANEIPWVGDRETCLTPCAL
jgi:hypothetical protein